MKTFYITLAALSLGACSASQSAPAEAQDTLSTPSTAQSPLQTETAIFAGGCFWCTESDFEKVPGVISAVSGYTGGHTENPTYKDVTYKNTGHYEAVKVTFDPGQVSYSELVEYYWTTVDPTDPAGQFCDKGDSYRTAIFAQPGQLETAVTSKTNLAGTKPFAAPIVTPVLPVSTFYDAEGYHQDYYKKNPLRYKYYRNGCGRDKRLKQLWGAK